MIKYRLHNLRNITYNCRWAFGEMGRSTVLLPAKGSAVVERLHTGVMANDALTQEYRRDIEKKMVRVEVITDFEVTTLKDFIAETAAPVAVAPVEEDAPVVEASVAPDQGDEKEEPMFTAGTIEDRKAGEIPISPFSEQFIESPGGEADKGEVHIGGEDIVPEQPVIDLTAVETPAPVEVTPAPVTETPAPVEVTPAPVAEEPTLETAFLQEPAPAEVEGLASLPAPIATAVELTPGQKSGITRKVNSENLKGEAREQRIAELTQAKIIELGGE